MIHGGLRYLERGEFGLAKESRAEPGALPMKIGLTLYDPVTRGRGALPPHQARNGRATGQNWSASYHDAWISYPERLGLELVVDTARMAPESPALTYAEIARDGDRFRLTDLETAEGLPIAARLLVNAAGACSTRCVGTTTRGAAPP